MPTAKITPFAVLRKAAQATKNMSHALLPALLPPDWREERKRIGGTPAQKCPTCVHICLTGWQLKESAVSDSAAAFSGSKDIYLYLFFPPTVLRHKEKQMQSRPKSASNISFIMCIACPAVSPWYKFPASGSDNKMTSNWPQAEAVSPRSWVQFC